MEIYLNKTRNLVHSKLNFMKGISQIQFYYPKMMITKCNAKKYAIKLILLKGKQLDGIYFDDSNVYPIGSLLSFY